MVGPGTSTGPSPNGPSSPNGLNCIIDKGAQRSCIGKKKFINIGGNPDNLSKSTHSYIFGDGKPSPSIGNTKIVFGNHEFYMDVVSRDVPGLIGMDILDSKDQGRSIFQLDISERQLLTVDGFKIQLLGARKCHLSLPNRLIPISPKYRQAETSHNNVHQNKLNLFQDVYHNELARDQDPLVRRGQLEGSPQSLSRKRQLKAS